MEDAHVEARQRRLRHIGDELCVDIVGERQPPPEQPAALLVLNPVRHTILAAEGRV